MSDTSRVTPFGLIFDASGLAAARFPDVRAQERSTEPHEDVEPVAALDTHAADTRDTLLHLPAAGALLRELLPEGAADSAHREIVEQVSALLFHAYRYWREGRMLYRFTDAALNGALAGAAPQGSAGDAAQGTIDVPAAAGYVQLPRNALWARVSEDAAPEPVDGFFWSAPAHAPGTYMPRLDLLLALGVRAARPGVSTVAVTVAPADLTQWASTNARPDGEDFANVLPGGELMGYRALATRAEAIKLAALCFARIRDADAAPDTDQGGDCVHTVDG